MTGGSRILMVCTANICRSPIAEHLATAFLRDRLGPNAAGITVASAGTAGWDGEPMQPHAETVLAEAGIDPSGFVARSLTPDLVEGADLILTAAREHRAAAVTLLPRAVARTFTIFEFARLLDGVNLDGLTRASEAGGLGQIGPGSPDPVRAPAPAATLAWVATRRRGRAAPPTPGADDLPDPYLGSLEDFRDCRDALGAALAGPLELLSDAVRS
ncbi:MAG: protein tyrosine phosphatase [Frankia sp.]